MNDTLHDSAFPQNATRPLLLQRATKSYAPNASTLPTPPEFGRAAAGCVALAPGCFAPVVVYDCLDDPFRRPCDETAASSDRVGASPGDKASMMRRSAMVPRLHRPTMSRSSRPGAARSAILRSASAERSRAMASTAAQSRSFRSASSSRARSGSIVTPRSRPRRMKARRRRCSGV
jgi:hypothetical protein